MVRVRSLYRHLLGPRCPIVPRWLCRSTAKQTAAHASLSPRPTLGYFRLYRPERLRTTPCGLAHLCYLRAFWRHFILMPLSLWALVYALWWIVLLLVLAPRAGGIAVAVARAVAMAVARAVAVAVAVAIYGVTLGYTAVLASRCHRLILIGGAFVLSSDPSWPSVSLPPTSCWIGPTPW